MIVAKSKLPRIQAKLPWEKISHVMLLAVFKTKIRLKSEPNLSNRIFIHVETVEVFQYNSRKSERKALNLQLTFPQVTWEHPGISRKTMGQHR